MQTVEILQSENPEFPIQVQIKRDGKCVGGFDTNSSDLLQEMQNMLDEGLLPGQKCNQDVRPEQSRKIGDKVYIKHYDPHVECPLVIVGYRTEDYGPQGTMTYVLCAQPSGKVINVMESVLTSSP